MSFETTAHPPLRLWPGVIAAVLLVLVRVVLPAVWPDQTLVAVLGGLAGAAAILLWWLFFSRARWADRLGVLLLTVVGLGATWFAADVSISTGAMGGLLPMLALPPLTVALVVWALAARHLSAGARRGTMAATILLACATWTLVKTGGFDQSFDNDLMWRWAQTPGDCLVADSRPHCLLLGQHNPPPCLLLRGPAPLTLPRATRRRCRPKKTLKPPWRTLEPSGPDSAGPAATASSAACASTPTGPASLPLNSGGGRSVPAGRHSRFTATRSTRRNSAATTRLSQATVSPPASRFWSHRDARGCSESNGGAGPRATPTLAKGRVYTLGATGVLNVLDARTGALAWSRNAAADAHAQTPMWGFAGSPLVVGDALIVGTSGTMVGYDAATGKLRWVGPQHTFSDAGSYSSPQHVTINGVEQVVLLSEAGATGVAPADGRRSWEHPLSRQSRSCSRSSPRRAISSFT